MVSQTNLIHAVGNYPLVFLAQSGRPSELDGLCTKAFTLIERGSELFQYTAGFKTNEKYVELDQETIKTYIWNRTGLNALKNRLVPDEIDGILYYSVQGEGLNHLDLGWFIAHAKEGGKYNVAYNQKNIAITTKDVNAGEELILKFDQKTHDGMEKSAAFIDKLSNDTEGLQKAKAMNTSELPKDTKDIVDSINSMIAIAKPSSINGVGIFVGEDGDVVIKEQLLKSDKVNPFPIANGSNYGNELSRTIDIPLEDLDKLFPDEQRIVYLERYLMEYEIKEGVYVLPIPIVGITIDPSYYINTTHNDTLGESNLKYDRSRKGGMSGMSITKELNVGAELFLEYPLPNGEKGVKTNKKIAKQQRKKKKKAKAATSSTTDGKTEGMDTSIESDVDMDSVMSDSSNGNKKSDDMERFLAALGGNSRFEDKPPQPPRTKEEKFKLPTATEKAIVPHELLPERWRCLVMKKYHPKQLVLVLYYNPDSDDHMEPLFHAERLYKDGYTSDYVDKNSLEYVAGQPNYFGVDELVKAGDEGVEHRYRFLVIAYDENNKEHVAMKSKGKKIVEYGGEYGAIIIDQKLLAQALTEAKTIGKEATIASVRGKHYYIVTESKNNNKILEKYENKTDLVSDVGVSWKDGGYSESTANGNLKEGHIDKEGMKWKEVYLRKFDRKDGSLEEWLGKIGNNASRYEDIETDKERLNELLTPEIAQYYLYLIDNNDSDEKIDEETVQLPENLAVESLGTFGDAAKVCEKLEVTSGRKKQDIREKLKKKNLEMAGHGPSTKTWAKGTEAGEEAWCVLEVENSTYLVRGSKL